MDFRGKSNIRGIKNNNPGNIVKSNTSWQGKVPLEQNTDKRFEQFISMEYGIRALMKNVITWVNRGENTIEKLIHKWAPTFENNTKKYIEKVSKDVSLSPKEIIPLNEKMLIALAISIAQMENGTEANKIPSHLYKKAYDMIGKYTENQNVKKKVL